MAESHAISAPLPGIFYRRPAPQAPPFAEPGAAVNAGDVIGLIEVMKTFYDVKSDASGTLERFLVNHGDIVDAGQRIALISE